MPDIDLVSRLAGGMLGLLVGDALGVPYEFRSSGTIGKVEFRGHGSHDQPAGTWSDDGARALALADSLLPATGAASCSRAATNAGGGTLGYFGSHRIRSGGEQPRRPSGQGSWRSERGPNPAARTASKRPGNLSFGAPRGVQAPDSVRRHFNLAPEQSSATI